MVKQALALSRISLLLVAVYWPLLFLATHTPVSASPVSLNSLDKIVHFGAFFVLAVLVAFFLFVKGRRTRNWMIGIFAGLCVYAAVDELLQIPVGRYCDPADWVADVLGIAAGLTCFLLVANRATSKRRDDMATNGAVAGSECSEGAEV